MGSASKELLVSDPLLGPRAEELGRAIATHKLTLLTGATTGVIHLAGKAARQAGALHVGISPAADEQEHLGKFGLPVDACDILVYTGFGLKGRNVVLVRSCDIVLFVAGAMGSLNEFTIAHDEGKIIGCLTGTGGVADQADYVIKHFGKGAGIQAFQSSDPETLLTKCLRALANRQKT